ncbi:MAG: DMT family transporter [Propionibacteriaceae bacterium]|nr:DMT family transporter [Propionibacteriaceae bacterium]
MTQSALGAPAVASRPRGRELAGYALMATIWGSSFFFTTLALRSFAPLTIVAARMSIAAVVLGLAVAMARPGLPGTRAEWLHLAWLGCFNITFPSALVTIAQLHIASSTSTVLGSTTPLFVFLFALLGRDERFDSRRLGGILLCFSGVAVMALYGRGISTDGGFWPLVMIAACAIYATGNIYTRRHLRKVPTLTTAWLQITFGALWSIPAVLLLDGWRIGDVTVIAVVAVIELGVLASAACYLLFFWFIRHWGSTATSFNTYLQPIVGILLGVLILNERASLGTAAGMALVLSGIACFAWGAARGLRGRDPQPELPPTP